jgi:membrane protein required for beta-lactamase induction
MGQSDSREPTDFRPRNVFSTFEIEEDSEDWSFDEYELSRYNKWRRSFQRAKKFVRRCFTRFVMENWLFLVMLGVSCALVGLFIDLLIFWFYHCISLHFFSFPDPFRLSC